MLEIQLEQLDADERRILHKRQRGGRTFLGVGRHRDAGWRGTLDQKKSCDKLSGRQQFIRSAGVHAAADGSPSARYEFRHSLYRQALLSQSLWSEPVQAPPQPRREADACLCCRQARVSFGTCAALRRRPRPRASRSMFNAGGGEHGQAIFLSRHHSSSAARSRTHGRSGAR